MPLPPPSRDPVRVALVGLGGHGRTIQHAFEAAGFAVVGVFDVNADEAALAAARFGCPAFSSYEALLATPGLEAVALVTPNRLHRAQAEAAFAAGLHVLVEKPIAHTTADGAAIVAAGEAAGRVLVVGHNMRYGAPARHAGALLASGALGEIVSVEVHFASDTGRHLAAGSWRLRPDEAPLLPVTQLGIHGIDLVHALAGPIETVSAFARTVAAPAGVVDAVVASFGIGAPSGPLGANRPGADRRGAGPLGTLVSHYCTPVRFAWTITGTEGHLFGTPHTLDHAHAGSAAETVVDVRADGYESYVALAAAFAHAVRTGEPPESGGAEGVLALAVVEAMQASAAAGGAAVDVAGSVAARPGVSGRSFVPSTILSSRP